MKFIENLQTVDVIAILLVIGAIISNWKGLPFMIPESILFVIGYYFGFRITKNGWH
jgi:hypothetical protein